MARARPSAGVGGGFSGSSSGAGCTGSGLEGCSCTTGSQRDCYTGATSTAGVGACALGTQACTAQGMGELAGTVWGPCLGSTLPSIELCGDDVDNVGCVTIIIQ